MKGQKRDLILVPAFAMAVAAPWLDRPVYLSLWYSGWALVGLWLVLDIRARRKP